jgi:pimeloyl-ACP methyl ester carboxylesterase
LNLLDECAEAGSGRLITSTMIMKYHFVLVHGACHGAWEWYKLADRLEAAGHKATALDLAGCGIHPADPNTITTYSQYMQPLTDFVASLPVDEKVPSLAPASPFLSRLCIIL